MPTFSSRGGRTFAGGDIIPLLIACPQADAASKSESMRRVRSAESNCERLLISRFLSSFSGLVATYAAARPRLRTHGKSALPIKSMARSIGMRTVPAFWSTQS